MDSSSHSMFEVGAICRGGQPVAAATVLDSQPRQLVSPGTRLKISLTLYGEGSNRVPLCARQRQAEVDGLP